MTNVINYFKHQQIGNKNRVWHAQHVLSSFNKCKLSNPWTFGCDLWFFFHVSLCARTRFLFNMIWLFPLNWFCVWQTQVHLQSKKLTLPVTFISSLQIINIQVKIKRYPYNWHCISRNIYISTQIICRMFLSSRI